MKNPMKTELDNAIKILIKIISSATTADEVLKYTQAVVNLANAQYIIS